MKYPQTVSGRVVGICSDGADGVHKYRRYLPQVLACFAKNLLIFQIGFTLAFPTILIAALTGHNPELNPNETIHSTSSESSWIASISFICQPLGSVFSGLITEPIGRKWAMIAVNIPVAIAWLIMYSAQDFNWILMAFGLLGISVGLMEASVLTYIGEVTEPSVRGVLSVFAGIAFTGGLMFVYVLGACMSWRSAALICFCVPWITAFIICFVPETPIWLLFKNRSDDAIRALQWLRGWVPSAAVMDEFSALQRYKNTVQCEAEKNAKVHGKHTFLTKFRDLYERTTLLPLILLTFMFFIAQFCGMFSMRPYITQILIAYQSPVDPSVVAVWLGVLGILANVIMMASIHAFGKRSITLISMAITFISCFVLGGFGFIFLPSGTMSFDQLPAGATHSVNLPDALAYVPLVSIYVMHFATSFATCTPNLLLCELFPFKSRAFATGLAASSNYIFAFAGAKLYFNFETWMSLPGTVTLFGFIGGIGFIGMYMFLPETEGRSLEDIETYFADKNRKLTDISIVISSASNGVAYPSHTDRALNVIKSANQNVIVLKMVQLRISNSRQCTGFSLTNHCEVLST